jgi:2-polyprenyl-6-hydroxyphenyl methylase/3-demethylubiquinone-9 3-methyltransferase
MWQALENSSLPVADGGHWFIAIYNDHGGSSRLWCQVKQVYCSELVGKTVVSAFFFPYFVFKGLAADFVKGKNPLAHYSEYKKSSAMSIFHDWYDWLGGYPFEVAKPEQIFLFYRDRGFVIKNLLTDGGGLENNQFVLTKYKQ